MADPPNAMKSHARSLLYSGAGIEGMSVEAIGSDMRRTSEHRIDHCVCETRAKDGDHCKIAQAECCMAVEAKPNGRHKRCADQSHCVEPLLRAPIGKRVEHTNA